MSNIGYSNHIKFRTKPIQQINFLEGAIIQGEQLSQKMFKNRRLQANRASPLSKRTQREESNSPLSTLRRAQKMKKDNRVSLKLQLMNLTIENYQYYRPRSTLSRQIRQRTYTYKGKSHLKPDRSFRPSTSVTIEIQPRRYQSLQQNIELIQNNRYSLFLPMKSSRYGRIHS